MSMLRWQFVAERLRGAAARVAGTGDPIIREANRSIEQISKTKILNLGLPLALMLVFTPFFPGLSAQYGITHPARILATYMVVVAALMAFRKGLHIRPHLLDVLFICFIVFVIGSLIIEGPQDKKQGLVYMISVMLTPYTFARLLTQSDITIFIRATAGLALILVPICIFGILRLGYYDATIERLILFGWLFGPGTFGLAIGMLIPLSVVFILSGAKHEKMNIMAWLLIISIAMWVVLTLGARSVFVSGLLASVLILLFARNVAAKWRLALAVFLSVSAFVSFASLPNSRLDFFSQLVTTTSTAQDCHTKGNSTAVRYTLYGEAIGLLTANPISGVGAGNFGFYSCFKNQGSPFASPHSTVLHVLSELGVVGGLLFIGIVLIASIGLVWRVWQDGFDGKNLTVWMLTALWIYYFTVDQFSHSYFTVVHFFLLVGVIASLLASGRFSSVGGRV